MSARATGIARVSGIAHVAGSIRSACITRITRIARIAVLLVVAALAVACSKKEDKQDKPPAAVPLLEPGEAARGMEACQTWVKRLCDCAKTKPALADECELRKGRPRTLDMVLGVIQSDEATEVAKLKARSTAKKLIKSCIEHDNKLSNECPR